MKKTDLRDILQLVKRKLRQEPETACGLFWTDSSSEAQIHEPAPTPEYAVAEPIVEPRVTTLYSVGEEDGGPPKARYAISD